MFIYRSNPGRKVRMLVFLFPVFLMLTFLFLKVVWPTTYLMAVREDSVVEYVQAFSYLLSAIIAYLFSMRLRENRLTFQGVLFGILAILLLLASLEEISWGQRILGVDVPDYFMRNNIQREITIHNLNSVQNMLPTIYALIGIYGAFGWMFLLRLDRKSSPEGLGDLDCFVPDWYLSSYFFLCFIINILLAYILPLDSATGIGSVLNVGFLGWHDQELAELFLSIGMLGFCFDQLSRVNSSRSLFNCCRFET